MKEIWKDIESFEGKYQVSNLGRVRALRFVNNIVDKKRKKPLVLKCRLTPGGRIDVSLSRDGKYVWRLVHRLVLNAFVGPCPPGMECAHLDGNPKNNNLENLKWCTHIENESHKYIHGTQIFGNRNGMSRYRKRLREMEKTL